MQFTSRLLTDEFSQKTAFSAVVANSGEFGYGWMHSRLVTGLIMAAAGKGETLLLLKSKPVSRERIDHTGYCILRR
jgi:hypothetical protein